jgi:hypothetical protein
MTPIKATTKRSWRLLDGASDNKHVAYVVIDPGEHELERIHCPLGHDCNWLVLKGTLIGASEGWWRDWSEPKYDEFQIVIEG